MIFSGETHQQWRERVSTEWQSAFALFPKQMNTGEWVWLGYYEWLLRPNCMGDHLKVYRLPGSNWSYREPQRPPAPPPMRPLR